MEPDFDKVIDALMRSSPLNGGVADRASGNHYDADEIAAFAENTVPAAARQTYILHFADCGRCRSILSDVVSLNADAANASASSVVTTATTTAAVKTDVPWYKRLFAMPNLAYGLGGLILLFSGFIGYTVLNNMSKEGSMVSQTSNRSMPAQYEAESSASAAANTDANAAASTVDQEERLSTANAASNAASRDQYTFEPSKTPDADNYTRKLNQERDGATAAEAAPPPPPKAAPITRKAISDEETKAEAETQATDVAAAPQPAPKDVPMFGRQSVTEKRRAEAPATAGNAAPIGTAKRSVGGKSFEQRNGVWYDAAYNGQQTTNVRRGTVQYRDLDSGLRSITDNLRGPVVVVWKDTAYRID